MRPSYAYKATVQRIVDGDTLVMDVDLGFLVKVCEKFRLAHINAPEKSDKAGWDAAVELIKRLLPEGSVVTVLSLGKDKYGRWLAEVYAGDVYVNGALLDAGVAVLYGK